MAILASALVTWIPRILPFLLVKYKGTAGSCDPFSNTCPFPLSLPCFIKFSRWKIGSPLRGSLVGPSSDHSQSLCSLVAKPDGNRFVWNCLDRPLTIGILNEKYVTKSTIVTKNLIL